MYTKLASIEINDEILSKVGGIWKYLDWGSECAGERASEHAGERVASFKPTAKLKN
jgi:hypothetical protein